MEKMYTSQRQWPCERAVDARSPYVSPAHCSNQENDSTNCGIAWFLHGEAVRTKESEVEDQAWKSNFRDGELELGTR